MINELKNELDELTDMINESAIIKNFERLKLRILKKVIKDHVSQDQWAVIQQHYKDLLEKTAKIKLEMLKGVRKSGKKSVVASSKPRLTKKKVAKKSREGGREMIKLTRSQFQNLDNDQQDHLIKILTNPTASNKFKQDLAKYYLGLRKDRPNQNAV